MTHPSDKQKTDLEASITTINPPFKHNSTAGLPGEEKLWEKTIHTPRNSSIVNPMCAPSPTEGPTPEK